MDWRLDAATTRKTAGGAWATHTPDLPAATRGGYIDKMSVCMYVTHSVPVRLRGDPPAGPSVTILGENTDGRVKSPKLYWKKEHARLKAAEKSAARARRDSARGGRPHLPLDDVQKIFSDAREGISRESNSV